MKRKLLFIEKQSRVKPIDCVLVKVNTGHVVVQKTVLQKNSKYKTVRIRKKKILLHKDASKTYVLGTKVSVVPTRRLSPRIFYKEHYKNGI